MEHLIATNAMLLETVGALNRQRNGKVPEDNDCMEVRNPVIRSRRMLEAGQAIYFRLGSPFHKQVVKVV